MEELWNIYHKDKVDSIEKAKNTDALQRLSKVGMNCGCEYTQLPVFKDLKFYYSRYLHSVGVALIAYQFSKDDKQALAGLFHDIATPCFAHVIDFLNHDYLKQESTEEKTSEIIQNDAAIQSLLQEYHLSLSEVDNYHLYPLCDNDSPKLSADRLEYTLGNMYNYGFATIQQIQSYYEDLIVGTNELNEKEIMFQHELIASEFSFNMMKCSRLYSSDNDRYAMERLARLLKSAIKEKIIEQDDLYRNEEILLQKLNGSEKYHQLWHDFRSIHEVKSCSKEKDGAFKIIPKKRFIDAYVAKKGRISDLNGQVKQEIEDFKALSYDYYLYSDI